MSMLLIVQILTFTFALWFGLYLLTRNPEKIGLRFAGLGLVIYALGIGMDAMTAYSADIARFRAPLLFLPPLLWLGAAFYLLPDTIPDRLRDSGLLLLGALSYIIGVVVNSNVVLVLLSGAAVLLSAWAAYRVWRIFRSGLPRKSLTVLLTAAIFFLLSNIVLLIPQSWRLNEFIVLAIGLDLGLLAYAIVALDAYDEGEALLPDFLRSFGTSMLAALLLGGQVILIMAITASITLPMIVLLMAVITTALTLQVLSEPLHVLLDRLLLARLQQERIELRGIASALPRMNRSIDPALLNEDEFIRLTRRALSHMGDFSRLASSPLIRLPIIDLRLEQHGGQNSTLERAVELRALLSESIEKLKPRDGVSFGTTDEWRYYNALYFPYVAGIKPFSRHDAYDDLDPDTQAALEWFQASVPERTLHNWQNAAAKLIALDLRQSITL